MREISKPGRGVLEFDMSWYGNLMQGLAKRDLRRPGRQKQQQLVYLQVGIPELGRVGYANEQGTTSS